ncbi:MAG: preprotein translocase subunit SecG [Deltaproteobacteria bacterium]|nr:preprotein translocase subunit SecG [Deltaproteobacteria bacterium]
MTGFILTFHFIICIFMIIVVLLQAGKGADIGASFGGGSQTVFGPRGAATLLSKITTGAAILFLLTSILLAHLAKDQSNASVINGAKLPTPKAAIAESQKAETRKTETQKADSKKADIKNSESLKTEVVEEKTEEAPAAAETQKVLTPKKKARSKR